MSLRVGFAGTPEFASTALAALHEAGHALPLVLTQPDRPSGRGLKLAPSPVKRLAQHMGAEVVQPRSLRQDGKFPEDAASAAAALARARLDVMVVAAYGLILPAWVLELPRLGCLNIHASLLPRWRGAAPIHRAIEAGDEETGITIMRMDEGLDTGPMLLWRPVSIEPTDTTARLHDRLALLGGQLIVRALQDLEQRAPDALAQPIQGANYAHKIDKSEAAIDWTLSAVQIERRLRAFDPFPGAHFDWAGEQIKVWAATVVPEVRAPAGQIVDSSAEGFTVACGEAGLLVRTIQRPGGRRQDARTLIQAHPELHGMRLASRPGPPCR